VLINLLDLRLMRYLALVLVSMTVCDRACAEVEFEALDLGTAAPLAIDGGLEDVWSKAPVYDRFVEYRPREGVPATVRTEVRFARDAQALYVAAKMFDPDISKLRSGLARRDGYANEQDWFQLVIDPIGNRRVAQMIYVNPHGVIWDGLYNDESGTFNTSADFDVEVAAQVQADSWVVEMRIPFAELRYALRDGDHWNVMVRRSTPRAERHAMAMPEIPSSSCFVCFAAPLRGLDHLPAPTLLEFNAQLVGLSRGEGTATDDMQWHSDLEPALELKYRMSAATVLDATINPDFSQVELDTPQLSTNEQFAVVLKEKRPFFLEGLDILDSPLTAIYTRSITDPAWGLRGTHRGNWDGVFLTARDEGGGLVVLPGALDAQFAAQDFSSQATIGRTRLPRGPVTMGALLTDRRTSEGYNTVFGPDLAWLISPQSQLRLQWLSSRTQGGKEFPGVGDLPSAQGDALNVSWEYASRHWEGELEYERLDDAFRADLGFIPQVGIRRYEGELGYRFRDLAAVSVLEPYAGIEIREDLGGQVVNESPTVGIEAELPRNTLLMLEWHPREQTRVRADSPLRSVQQFYVFLSSSPTRYLPAMSFEATLGEAIDFDIDRAGRGETVSATVLLRPLSRLEIEPRFDFTTVRTEAVGTDPGQEVFESAAQLLATLHVTSRDRFRLIAQYADIERKESASGAHLVDRSRVVGSLLYTHERSLATRFYAGVSYADSDSLGPLAMDEVLEFFVKFQIGFAPGAGIRW
jgi:hypothetical protein